MLSRHGVYVRDGVDKLGNNNPTKAHLRWFKSRTTVPLNLD